MRSKSTEIAGEFLHKNWIIQPNGWCIYPEEKRASVESSDGDDGNFKYKVRVANRS